MDKIVDITKELKNQTSELEKSPTASLLVPQKKTTNPILKKLANFRNENMSKKFDINELFR